VQQGASLILVLDAHARHPEPFASQDLVQFADATLPAEQLESEQRRRIMRLARSTKRRPALFFATGDKQEHETRRRSVGAPRIPSRDLA